ncbi:helix-turn-helix transcriptional regulator [Lentzea sp. BCCO 10_0798]|uniref:Helix-turn-helix transcriptional regulator n=1 Tax=Lentzea kristufekii TaxID=3095430 RepID=A0ABU4U187_9PSEU|nr:helix-turn-helix transcriptional regulator [Lentzea sp. BCCO 10_0798]MDX8054323.1 helix-turn-helix transcriptional regulator [Lentzea sp. BCCO 10_0798]
MPKRVSTVLGREFGDNLRAMIARTGLKEAELARRLGWEHAKLSDLVNGKGGTSLEEFTYLLGVCGVKPDEFQYLKGLFLESREKGWLQLYESVLPPHVRTLIQHERLAKEIVHWSSLYLPGLLQIEPYARAVAEDSPFIEAEEVPRWVAARMERRTVVAGHRKFIFYVYEPVLYSQVGGADVMTEQLHELLRMLIRPYITLRVLPAGRALTGDFSFLKFEKYEPVVYQGSLNSALFLDDRASIGLYQDVVKTMDRVALGREESRELITSIAS